MNALGIKTPNCGWRARANASAPTSCFLRRSILGWYQNSIQSWDRASARSRRPATAGGWPSLCSSRTFRIDAGLERLSQHRQHLQPLLLADALDVREHRGAAAAHELYAAAIAAGAERHDAGDRLRGFQRDVEEHEIGRTLLERRTQSMCRRRILRYRCRRRAERATENGGCCRRCRRRSKAECGFRRRDRPGRRRGQRLWRMRIARVLRS